MNLRHIIVITLFIYSISCSAQFFDDFSSGSLTTNQWQGDTAKFKFSNSTAIPASMRPALQLNDTISNVSAIAATYSFNPTDSTEWDFWLKLSFTPTSSNFARIYLMSDQATLKENLNGYFIGIGETDKRITLSRQNGTTVQNIITGNVAFLNKSTNQVRVRVIRNTIGEWKLYSDTLGTTNWLIEGVGVDNLITTSLWQGLYCKYTSSNATKIYFDEFYTGTIQQDTAKPTVLNVQPVSEFQLDIIFSKPVNDAQALDKLNYTVSNGIGNPTSILKDVSNSTLYHLSFSQPFLENTVSSITIQNIADMTGNMMEPATIDFSYYISSQFDILINEIMADPDPVVGLPNAEYIELYNRSNYPISLNSWNLYIGTTIHAFSNVSIPSKQYLIICGASSANLFESYGNVYAFSSISLPNSGQTIYLSDKNGKLIHSVSYSDTWYPNSIKKNGGWSLELVDLYNPCAGQSNWKASVHPGGGTPGAQNSVFGTNPDNTKPQLVRVAVLSETQIQVWFNEAVSYNSAIQQSKYLFSNGLSLTAQPEPILPDYQSVKLTFQPALQQGVIYTLTLNESVQDCAGNSMLFPVFAKFALAEKILPNDIVINEILSNPPAGLEEFVEIYNNSNKVLDLKDLYLATTDSNTGKLISQTNIGQNGYLFFPENFVVLSKNIQGIKDYYYCPSPDAFIPMSSFPSYNNDNGVVVLVNVNDTVIDKVLYDVSMHFPLLTSTKGVSFERVNYNRPSTDKTNWHSASESVGFATPGYKNSQYADEQSSDELLLYPDIFSPDNDGYNDLLQISYSLPQSGYVGSITIFDTKGRLIRNLVNNNLFGITGTYSWDGTTNDNQKAAIGIYIVYIDLFNINSDKKTFKKTTVLGGKLN